jgi:hypothetical protein
LETHEIAAELKELVGWGVIPRKMDRIPALASLLELEGRPSKMVAKVKAELTAAIESLDGQYQLEFTDLPAEGTKTALLILLGLNRAGHRAYAQEKRRRAIDMLGLSSKYTADQWRKQDSPELEFMTILAEQLVRRAEEREANYLRESIDFSVYFDARGAISKVEVFCEVTALQDGISSVDAVAEYRADPREGVLKINPTMGCNLTRFEDSRDRPGHVYAELSIPNLKNGVSHRYAYTITVKSDRPSESFFFHQPTVQTKSLSVALYFYERVPTQVWPFAGVPFMQLPGRSRILLPLSDDGIYRKRFTEANIHLCYGLAFRWP